MDKIILIDKLGSKWRVVEEVKGNSILQEEESGKKYSIANATLKRKVEAGEMKVFSGKLPEVNRPNWEKSLDSISVSNSLQRTACIKVKSANREKIVAYLKKVLEAAKIPDRNSNLTFRIEDADSNIYVKDVVYKRGTKYLGEVVGIKNYIVQVKFGDRVIPVWLQEIRKCKR